MMDDRLHDALRAAGIGTWRWDIIRDEVHRDGVFEVAVSTFDRGMQMIHPEDQERVRAALDAALAGTAPYEIEFRMRWPDASLHWIASKATVQRDPTGRPVSVTGIAMDVTARKRTEAFAARERSILEEISTGTALPVILDELMRLLEAQAPEMLCSVLLLDDAGRLRHGAAPSLPPAYLAALDGIAIGPDVGSCGTAAYRRERVVVTDIATDPKWAPFRDLALSHGLHACWSTPIIGADGKVLGTCAMYYRQPRAPTPDELALLDRCGALASIAIAHAQTMARLAQKEGQLRAIVDSEPECVKVLDRAGRLLNMNPAGLAMVEADSLGQILGQSVLSLVLPEHRPAFDALHARVFAGESGVLEFEMVGLRGTRRRLETHAVPLRDQSGAITALLGITRDVTDRHRAEEALLRSRAQLRRLAARQQAVREEERARLAREIHDELGQVLTALKIDLQWLQQRVAAPAPRPRVLPVARSLPVTRKLKDMSALLDRTLADVHRIATELRPGVLDDLGLQSAVQWLTADFEQRTGIRSEAHVSSPEETIEDGQATAAFRILQEALTNIARHAQATHVDVRLEVTSDTLELTVTDDGRGISETEAAAPRSLGLLGMSERALACGGVVTVFGRPGGGTTVALHLPRDRRDRARTSA